MLRMCRSSCGRRWWINHSWVHLWWTIFSLHYDWRWIGRTKKNHLFTGVASNGAILLQSHHGQILCGWAFKQSSFCRFILREPQNQHPIGGNKTCRSLPRPRSYFTGAQICRRSVYNDGAQKIYTVHPSVNGSQQISNCINCIRTKASIEQMSANAFGQ